MRCIRCSTVGVTARALFARAGSTTDRLGGGSDEFEIGGRAISRELCDHGVERSDGFGERASRSEKHG